MKAWTTKGLSFLLLVIGFSLCSVPVSAAAGGLQITEIMYDLPGSDSGREWVEITNTGTDAVDIAGYRLTEGGTNHLLSVVSGTTTLAAGQSVIVASNVTKFLADWPQYAGTLFKSSFSLSNTGETVEIKDAALFTLDSASYTADAGAAGDGNTLHRVGATLVAGAPDPGVYTDAAPAQPVETPAPTPAPSAPASTGETTQTPTPAPVAAPEPAVAPTPAATSASTVKAADSSAPSQAPAPQASAAVPVPVSEPKTANAIAPVATHAESVAVAPKASGPQSAGSKKSRSIARAASLPGNSNSSDMSASVAEAAGALDNPLLLYGFALGALMLLGAGAALYAQPARSVATSSRTEEFELE